MSLQDIALKTEYRSFQDDIAQDFYIPALKQAVRYKRAVGFFSSSILSMITAGLYEFYQHEGKIELLASPKLSRKDIEAIEQGYAARETVIERSLRRELLDYEDFCTLNRLNLLANLIADKRLDIKIVVPKGRKGIGMYHEKVGLLEDSFGNIVAFSGSMNESGNALEQNYESFDVFCSWQEADAARVMQKSADFTRLWYNLDSHASVQTFPEVTSYLVDKYRIGPVKPIKEIYPVYHPQSDEQIAETVDDNEAKVESQKSGFQIPKELRLYSYQQQAINSWRQHGYRGIFDMATGTGKTLTGLGALAALCEQKPRLAVIIVCPYQHLVDQWGEDIEKFKVHPIIGHSTSPQHNYKERLRWAVFSFNLEARDFFCFICTNATFAADWAQAEFAKLKEPSVLVVDEAHNFGAEKLMQTLQKNYTYRLALSATMDRHNDPEGTECLYRFFGDVCIHYDLGRAIQEKKLVPYDYYPVVIYLTETELKKYQQLTIEIGKGIYKKKGKIIVTQKAKTLLLKRSRIVAGAMNKVEKLREMMLEFKDKHDMLIYCGAAQVGIEDENLDIRQIDYISRMLNFELEMRTAQFTSKESMDERARRIEEFKSHAIQALVAIKCLDEGVNIPSIRTAFILASTTNPKEYIQRRGRVLRRYPGKESAVIYDFITLPRSLDEVRNSDAALGWHELALVKNELNRMVEFRNLARNFYVSDHLIDEIRDTYNIPITETGFVDEREEWG